MKKTMMVPALALFLTLPVLAQSCPEQGVLVAKVSRTKKDGYFSCKAFIDKSDVAIYEADPVCPLKLEAVLRGGIEVGIKDGHDCGLSTGDKIEGRVVRDSNGALFLYN